MIFPVVMYGCGSWTIKKAGHWRIDAFEPWCWIRLLRVPWTARRSDQSILKKSVLIFIGRTDVEAETPIFWPPDVKNWFIWKDPDAGKDWRWWMGQQSWGGWMASPTQWTWVWVNSRSWWWTRRPAVLQSMGSQRVEHDWATELNWSLHLPFLSSLEDWRISRLINWRDILKTEPLDLRSRLPLYFPLELGNSVFQELAMDRQQVF